MKMQIKKVIVRESLKQSYLDYSRHIIVGDFSEILDAQLIGIKLNFLDSLAMALFEYILNHNLTYNIPTYFNVNIKYFQNKITHFNIHNFMRPFKIPCQILKLYHKFKALSNLPSKKIAS